MKGGLKGGSKKALGSTKKVGGIRSPMAGGALYTGKRGGRY